MRLLIFSRIINHSEVTVCQSLCKQQNEDILQYIKLLHMKWPISQAYKIIQNRTSEKKFDDLKLEACRMNSLFCQLFYY